MEAERAQAIAASPAAHPPAAAAARPVRPLRRQPVAQPPRAPRAQRPEQAAAPDDLARPSGVLPFARSQLSRVLASQPRRPWQWARPRRARDPRALASGLAAYRPALPGRERAAAISELVSGLVSEYIGHGPTARTYLNGDVLTVVVENSLTAGEQRLVRDGMSELVLSTRRAFHQTMREDLIARVEQLTGSKVRLSANQMEPDITVEVFVLDGASGGATAPGGR